MKPARLEHHARATHLENLLVGGASVLLGIGVAALVAFMGSLL